MKQLFTILLTLNTFLSTAMALDVDTKRLDAAMKILEKTASAKNENGASYSVVSVKGNTAEEMLKDYAKQNGYEKAIYFMTSDQVPQSEDDDVVGFAKNVDVVDYAIDLYRIHDNEKTELQKLRKEALSALFEATASGAKIGAEGKSWSTCGVYMPGLIILDPKAKKIYKLTPNETGC